MGFADVMRPTTTSKPDLTVDFDDLELRRWCIERALYYPVGQNPRSPEDTVKLAEAFYEFCTRKPVQPPAK